MEAQVAIIGAGPVGLFAAFQAGVLGMSAVLVDATTKIGGQCAALYPQKPIYDIPAYPEIKGQTLIDNLLLQLKPFDVQYRMGSPAVSIEKRDREFVITNENGTIITAKTVVVAAGSGVFGHSRLPIDGASDYENTSLFYHVDDTSIFADRKVAIAGGGDSALDWAIELSNVASVVHLIHRREKFRAMPSKLAKLESLMQNDKVKLVAPYQIVDLVGSAKRISKVRVRSLDGHVQEIETDYLLAFFGLRSNLEHVANWGLSLDLGRIPVAQDTMETCIEGIFAIGDVASYPRKLKLILCGFSEAALAMHKAYEYVYPGHALHFEHSTSRKVFNNGI